MMRLTVRLFAVCKQRVGRDQVQLELADGSTVAQLRRSLAAEFPQLAAVMPHVMIAVDGQYAADATVIPPHGDLACIPPVSGG
jgi:molybdopterin converting factor subunit 1